MSEHARDLLLRGRDAVLAKEREEARFYLEWVLSTDSDLDQQTEAWYLLSQIAANPAEQRSCLEEVLAAYPGHAAARRDLAVLDGRLKPEDILDPWAPPQPIQPPATPAPREVQRYLCPSCGGTLAHNPQRGVLACVFCGYQRPAAQAGGNGAVEERDWIATMHTAQGHRWVLPTARTLGCQGCGATVLLPPAHAGATCPFCGAPYVVVIVHQDLVEPEGIIPFAIDGHTALARAQEWITERRFRRDDLAAGATFIAPSPIYLPFWTFDLYGTVLAHRPPPAPRFGNPVPAPPPARYTVFCDDLLVPATTGLPAPLLEALHFDTHALVPYTAEHLVTWPAEIYRVAMANASVQAHTRVAPHFEKEALRIDVALGDSDVTLVIDRPSIYISSYKHVLLPVWVTGYQYKEGRYPVIVNGQSGQVHGRLPMGRLGRFLTSLGEP